jgi:hypothetical protein
MADENERKQQGSDPRYAQSGQATGGDTTSRSSGDGLGTGGMSPDAQRDLGSRRTGSGMGSAMGSGASGGGYGTETGGSGEWGNRSGSGSGGEGESDMDGDIDDGSPISVGTNG